MDERYKWINVYIAKSAMARTRILAKALSTPMRTVSHTEIWKRAIRYYLRRNGDREINENRKIGEIAVIAQFWTDKLHWEELQKLAKEQSTDRKISVSRVFRSALDDYLGACEQRSKKMKKI